MDSLTVAIIDRLRRRRALALGRDLQIIVENLPVDLIQLIVELPDLGVAGGGSTSQGGGQIDLQMCCNVYTQGRCSDWKAQRQSDVG